MNNAEIGLIRSPACNSSITRYLPGTVAMAALDMVVVRRAQILPAAFVASFPIGRLPESRCRRIVEGQPPRAVAIRTLAARLLPRISAIGRRAGVRTRTVADVRHSAADRHPAVVVYRGGGVVTATSGRGRRRRFGTALPANQRTGRNTGGRSAFLIDIYVAVVGYDIQHAFVRVELESRLRAPIAVTHIGFVGVGAVVAIERQRAVSYADAGFVGFVADVAEKRDELSPGNIRRRYIVHHLAREPIVLRHLRVGRRYEQTGAHAYERFNR